MTTNNRPKKITAKIVTMLGVSGIAGFGVSIGAFVLSFDAIKAVAEAAHVADAISWLMPVSVDGAMTVATMAAMVLKILGKKTRYPSIVFVVCLVISLACNALHATQSQTVGQGTKMLTMVKLEDWHSALVSAIPAVALALSLHLMIMLIEAVGDYVGGASEPVAETSPSEASEPTETMITVNPASLTGEATQTMISEPSPALIGGFTGEPVSEPPVTLTGEVSSEPTETPAGEASEPAPVNPPAPASEPPAKPARKPQAAKSKTTRTAKSATPPKIDITAMEDADLLELLARDFESDELSANKIRIRYGIGSDKAKVIFERWKALTDVTDEALAAVSQ